MSGDFAVRAVPGMNKMATRNLQEIISIFFVLFASVPGAAMGEGAAPTAPAVFTPRVSVVEEVREGHMASSQMPVDLEQEIARSIFQGGIAPKANEEVSFSPDKALQEAWEGNNPQVTAQVSGTVLRFRRSPDDLRGESGPDFFELLINYRGRELVVRSTTAKRIEFKSGLRLPARTDSFWHIYIEGTAHAGILFISPPSIDQIGAFLACPRYAYKYRTSNKGRWQLAFVDSGYRVNRAMFSATAIAKGKALSGGGIGLARAAISTSPTLPRSQEFKDEAYLRDPRIELEYHPYTSEVVRDIEMDGEIVAGIQSELTFQRPSGHKSHTIARSTTWVKEYPITQEQILQVLIGKKTLTSTLAQGPCYLIVQKNITERHFSREPLELPERLRAEAASGPAVEAGQQATTAQK